MINETEIELEVIPNSKEFNIIGFNQWTNALKIKVQGKAIKGQANKELVKKLEKIFQSKVQLIIGEKSREKKVLLKGISKDQFLKILSSKT